MLPLIPITAPARVLKHSVIESVLKSSVYVTKCKWLVASSVKVKFDSWLQKVAEENRPIEHDYDHLPLDDHSEDDYLMGIERDEADPKLWR